MSIASVCVTLREQWLRGLPVRSELRVVSLVLLTITMVVAGLIVFSPGAPAPAGQSALRRWAVVWRLAGLPPALTFESVEWLANVVMFLPIGFLSAGATRPRYRYGVAPLAAVASVLIETVQVFVPGRVSSVSDVVANTLGALAGAVLLVRISEWTVVRSIRRRPGGSGAS